MSSAPKYYVVWRGREPGIYRTWEACQQQVAGFPCALFKSFKSEDEAKAEFGCTNVLCHVHTGAVGTQQQFLVKSVLGKVGPYRTVLLAEEKALFQARLNPEAWLGR